MNNKNKFNFQKINLLKVLKNQKTQLSIIHIIFKKISKIIIKKKPIRKILDLKALYLNQDKINLFNNNYMIICIETNTQRLVQSNKYFI